MYDFTANPPIPSGFRRVAEAEFFKAVGKLNTHPSTNDPDRTVWRSPNDAWGAVHGISYPGWKFPGREEVYLLPGVDVES